LNDSEPGLGGPDNQGPLAPVYSVQIEEYDSDLLSIDRPTRMPPGSPQSTRRKTPTRGGFSPRPPRPQCPAGLLYVGMLLSWAQMEEPSAATMQPIVQRFVLAAGRCHLWSVVSTPRASTRAESAAWTLDPPNRIRACTLAGTSVNNSHAPGLVMSVPECTSSEPPLAGPQVETYLGLTYRTIITGHASS
jgi:hypothetical protein